MEFLTELDLVAIGKFLVDHLEGVAGATSVIIALMVFSQSNKDKKLEIYMNLYQQWDSLWVKITAYPLQNNELFQQRYQDISKKEEDLRFTIYQATTLLSRVFYYYQKTNQNIRKSDWHKEAEYMMKRPLFITAFKKYAPRYSKEFQSYMKSLIRPDWEKDLIENNAKTIDIKKVIKGQTEEKDQQSVKKS